MVIRKPLFLLMALCIGPAFAADGVVASRAISHNSDSGDVVSRATSRTSVSRGTPATTGERVVNRSSATSNRTSASRGTTSRATVASRGTASRVAVDTPKAASSRITTGDINDSPTVRRAGVVLRPSFADYGGRATISGTNTQTGSNIRNDIQKISSRATKINQATKESIADAREKMELTAELNKSCQEQYNECMDQFCSVIDSNQKRCSCSANLTKYTKVEKAVTDANAKLNEAAQAIRYVGLSADEIRAIMSETEAEEALNDNRDTSTTRNMLKQIESMIKDPTSSTSNYYTDSGWSFDMDLTFSSDPVDIFNLEFLNTDSNSNSISNLRGTELYNVAKKRCKTILTQCKDAGATQDQIIGNYDLAIDRDCIAYEAGLKKMNETLVSNVKSANLMLQKARLAVMQNKNQYDARGCVSALENCMKDDMVCGDDYMQCVDPTKAYIDENGEVVLGQDITIIQSFMTEYNNAKIDTDYLMDAYNNATIDASKCTGDGKCVVKYLMQKIGTKQRATDEGLCRPVLDKCQNYTYLDGVYQPYNDIVVNYIQRAMVNVKAAQQKIISDYASSCIVDVAACYNQQVSQVSSWASVASTDSIYNVMRGACRGIALTCGLAIFAGKPEIKANTEINVPNGTTYTPYTVSGCIGTKGKEYGQPGYNDAIVNCVSDMFYQSLLCPDNSTYKVDNGTTVTVSPNNTKCGWVNTRCQCNSGYMTQSGKCVAATNGAEEGPACPTITRDTQTGDPDKVSVNYNCGDAGGTQPNSQQVVLGSSVTLAAVPTTCNNDTAARSGSFTGWLCTGGVTGTKSAGTSVTNVTQGATCTAQWSWTNKTYSVTYQCPSGSGKSAPTDSTNYSYDSTVTVKDPSACAGGTQTCSTWTCGSQSGLTNGSSFNITANTTCSASCSSTQGGGGSGGGGTTPQSYTVSFGCGDGASGTAPDSRTVTAGQGTTLPTGVGSCKKTDRTFGGWSCKGIHYDAGFNYTPNGDVSCVVDWKQDSGAGTTTQYSLNYKCNAADASATLYNKYTQGTPVSLSVLDLVCQSGTLSGWKCNDVDKSLSDQIIMNTDATCVAQWQETPTGTRSSQIVSALNNSTYSALGATEVADSSTGNYSLVHTNDDLCVLFQNAQNGSNIDATPVGLSVCNQNILNGL